MFGCSGCSDPTVTDTAAPAERSEPTTCQTRAAESDTAEAAHHHTNPAPILSLRASQRPAHGAADDARRGTEQIYWTLRCPAYIVINQGDTCSVDAAGEPVVPEPLEADMSIKKTPIQDEATTECEAPMKTAIRDELTIERLNSWSAPKKTAISAA